VAHAGNDLPPNTPRMNVCSSADYDRRLSNSIRNSNTTTSNTNGSTSGNTKSNINSNRSGRTLRAPTAERGNAASRPVVQLRNDSTSRKDLVRSAAVEHSADVEDEEDLLTTSYDATRSETAQWLERHHASSRPVVEDKRKITIRK